tara:strand:+ start:318 stop:1775 length:1458 start_codon:yes stop_codon:yes gene_type:complete
MSPFVEYWGKSKKHTTLTGTKKSATPVYMQFISGTVMSVNSSAKSFGSDASTRINSIVALPHFKEQILNTEASSDAGHTYWPLLRGITDIPVKGEQVLLTTIAGKNYYLGPLNTNNRPDYNKDKAFNSKAGGIAGILEDPLPKSANWIKNDQARLQKPISQLDKTHDYYGVKNRAINVRETYGDVVIEGRHGNSIRLGSRTDKPHIYISNGRVPTSPVESLGDASLIAMTTFGRIGEHFSSFKDVDEQQGSVQHIGFQLGSDMTLAGVPEQRPRYRTMGRLMDLLEIVNTTDRAGKSIEGGLMFGIYQDPNMLINSDRIVINSDTDNVVISSRKNLHMGASENLSISTEDDVVIESRNIFLGKEAYIRHNRTRTEDKSKMTEEPMVLGHQLTLLLEELITCLSYMSYINPTGAPSLIHGATPSTPSVLDPETGGGIYKTKPHPLAKSLEDIKNMIKTIKSEYHFIEPNVEGAKDPSKREPDNIYE